MKAIALIDDLLEVINKPFYSTVEYVEINLLKIKKELQEKDKKDNPVPSLANLTETDWMDIKYALEQASKNPGISGNPYKKILIKLQNGVETDKEEPKQTVLITQLFQQWIRSTMTKPKLVLGMENATRFSSVKQAKAYTKKHFGADIVFQYVVL